MLVSFLTSLDPSFSLKCAVKKDLIQIESLAILHLISRQEEAKDFSSLQEMAYDHTFDLVRSEGVDKVSAQFFKVFFPQIQEPTLNLDERISVALSIRNIFNSFVMDKEGLMTHKEEPTFSTTFSKFKSIVKVSIQEIFKRYAFIKINKSSRVKITLKNKVDQFWVTLSFNNLRILQVLKCVVKQYAEIFKTRDYSSGKVFSLKIRYVSKENKQNRDIIKKGEAILKHEMEMLLRLSYVDNYFVQKLHPELCSHNPPTLVCNWYEEEDLATFLNKNNLPLQAKLKIIAQVMKSVLFVVKHGVRHLDIKPENFFVEKLSNGQFCIVLGDFAGSSFQTDKANALYFKFSTPGYFSYEDYTSLMDAVTTKDEALFHITATQWDIFSTAVTIFEILTHTFPYLLDEELSLKFPRPNTLKLELLKKHPKLASFLIKMLDLDPKKRPSWEEISKEWEEILSWIEKLDSKTIRLLKSPSNRV